ncbi:hypothetical protein R1sor_016490 [Riccia sorocarpa]|uniref:Uncharacterized protein n=1 Tax=Riccia sorocarpa TaxID=122646 RepID=A0ABD3HH04_9MARC
MRDRSRKDRGPTYRSDRTSYRLLTAIKFCGIDGGPRPFFLNRSVSPASSCSSSSSNSEMKPRAMARSVGAQKNAARHRMTKQEYEMIVTYLENPDNFAAINGCGKKTKITGKTLTKVTAFGHIAVTLCAQGFVKCSGVIMGKKVARYVSTYKNARTFYLGTGSGLTEAEIDAGLTLEQKMNAKCHFFFPQHALFGARANVEPPAVGDAGLPAEIFFDDRDLCQDSQAEFQFSTAEPMLSGDEEEAADRLILSEDDEVDNQTAPVADAGGFFFETAMPDVTGGDAFYQIAPAGEDCGPEMGNQTGRSTVDVETNAVRTPQQNRVPQQSRGDASVQSVDDVRSSGKTVRSKDRPPPPERKTSLITTYEEQVKEKLILRKEAQYQKASFRDAILDDRRQAREQRERTRIQDGIEAMRRARADRRSTLLAEMVKTGKSMDEIHQYFLMLDSVEERLSGSM